MSQADVAVDVDDLVDVPDVDFEYDAVVLAGGQGERLGRISKADLEIGGRRLLDIVLEASFGARTQVVVGTIEVPYGVVQTVEDPKFGGPVAGLLAGLDAVTEARDWTLLLAVDLPGAVMAVRELLAAVDAEGPADGWCLTDNRGKQQYLLGIYRTTALRAVLDELKGDVRNRSMRRLLSRLDVAPVIPDLSDVTGIDTPEDRSRWERTVASVRPRDPAAWEVWVADACAGVDVDPALVDLALISDLEASVAERYDYAMASVATYILGLAVGRDPSADRADLKARILSSLPTFDSDDC